MKTYPVMRILCAALVLLGLAAVGLAAEVPTVEPAKVDQAPKLDGDLSDSCWQKGTRVSNFYRYDKEEPAQTQTEAFLAYDDQALYVAFRCFEPNPKGLVVRIKERDSGVHRDDCIELFVGPGTDGRVYYHFILNPANVRNDGRCLQTPRRSDISWDGDWKSATRVGSREWTVEMAIPWYNFSRDLDRRPWRINFCREKRSQPGEISSWAYMPKNFHQPQYFGQMARPQVDFSALKGLQVYDLSVRKYGVEPIGYSYVVTGVVKNTGTTARKILVECEDRPAVDKGSRSEMVLDLPPNRGAPFEIKMAMEALGKRTLGLRLRHPETKDALFVTSLGADGYPPLMTACLDRSYYTREKKARAIVFLNVPPTKERFIAQLEVRPEGKKPVRARAEIRDPARTVVSLSLARVPMGMHQATLRVTDRQGRLVAEQELRLRKHPPAPPGIHEVKVDRDRLTVLVDGKPFFPFGIYGVPPEYMKDMKEAGFNCTIRWSPGSTVSGGALKKARETSEEAGRELIIRYLDACQKAGLLVMEWPTLFGFGGGLDLHYANPKFAEDFAEFMKDRLRLVVEPAGKHPAVIAHYGPDEPGEPQRAQCREYSEIVWDLDPYHPNFFLFCASMKDWPEVYDIGGLDYYWGPSSANPFSVYRVVKKAAGITHRSRIPFWFVPLLERWSNEARAFTRAEQRAQTYLAAIAGGNGIIYFVWPPRYSENWAELCKLAGELKALSPILVEPTPAQEMRTEPREMEDTIQVLVKEHAGKTYLIAANGSEHPAEATFRLPGNYAGQGKVWFEDRAVTLRNSQFADRFEGYGTHVYELDGSWPSGGVVVVAVTLRPQKKVEEKPEAAKAEEVPSANLIADPGFETDYYWLFGGGDPKLGTMTGKFEEADAHSGKRCAVIRRPHGEGRATFSAWGVMLKPKTRYVFGCYARAEGAGGAVASLYLQGPYPHGSYLQKIATIRIRDRSPGWDRYFVSFATRDRPVWARPMCVFEGGTGTAWFDDVFLYESAKDVGSKNLLRNSGFEQETLPGWPDHWTPMYSIMEPGFVGKKDGIWRPDTKVVFEGKNSVRMVKRTPYDSSTDYKRYRVPCVYLPSLTMMGEKDYTFSVYLKADRPKVRVRLMVNWHVKNVTVSTEWARYSYTFKMKKDTNQGFVRMDLQGQSTLWVDAAQLEEGNQPTPYEAGIE